MLLFVNPNDYGKRDKLTLKVSFDDGMTAEGTLDSFRPISQCRIFLHYVHR